MKKILYMDLNITAIPIIAGFSVYIVAILVKNLIKFLKLWKSHTLITSPTIMLYTNYK